MDPKNRNGNMKPSVTPAQKLETLRNLRDNDHCLRSEDRPYDNDWFMGTILDEGLAGLYMKSIDKSNRV